MGHVTIEIEMTERYVHFDRTCAKRRAGYSSGPLRPHATCVQHGWRTPLTIRKNVLKKWRRRESNPQQGGSKARVLAVHLPVARVSNPTRNVTYRQPRDGMMMRERGWLASKKGARFMESAAAQSHP